MQYKAAYTKGIYIHLDLCPYTSTSKYIWYNMSTGKTTSTYTPKFFIWSTVLTTKAVCSLQVRIIFYDPLQHKDPIKFAN